MKEFFFLQKNILKRQSILRAYLNHHLSSIKLAGKTVDIGSGSGWLKTTELFKKESDFSYQAFDLKVGTNIDFEKDALPVESNLYDTVLFLNVMEHIFNYQNIANEVMRIVKPNGQMVGYVPFLMWYHPDHSDFFRYTDEAIEKIFTEAGASDIEIIPNRCGPFVAANQMMNLSVPLFVRPIIFSFSYLLDRIYFLLKGNESESRYVLGYLFICRK